MCRSPDAWLSRQMKSEFSKIFSISGDKSGSLTFCVAPVGMPPHLRKTLPNLAGKGRCLFLPQQQMKFITKNQVALPLVRFCVTRPQIWSWTISIPIFFSRLPSSLMSKATMRLSMSTLVRWLNTFKAAVHIQVKGLGHPVGLRDVLV